MFTLDVDTDLKLALVDPKFAPQYLEIVSREREYLSQWLAWPPHANSEEFFLSFIKRSLHDYADGKSLVCGMIYKDKLVGNISFNSISYQLKKVEMGYWLSSDYQGKGIVSRSVLKLIDVAFTDLDMEKVQIVHRGQKHNKRLKRDCQRVAFPVPLSRGGYGCCV
ncbi:Ribosomal-protein-serine acetyltransferase [Vibrio cholerae]|nr:Ribosomal-protein-serine acetyltransferase [Vibrio cholerae]